MAGPESPKVAVIVRTKDRPELLRRALESLLGQTYPAWEAVIVNDGGARQPVADIIAAESERIGGRLRVVDHPTSTGRWPSANAGIAATHAPYVVLHDDDDSWHPDFLAQTAAFLDEHPDEWGVIARAEVIHERYEGDSFVETFRYRLEDHNPEVLLTDLLDFNRFVPIQFLYRRTLHEQLGLYDSTKSAAADWMFNMQVVALRPVRYVSRQVLSYWHQRPGVEGVQGNSVFAAPIDHRLADRRHRDEALRQYINAVGPGLPLFLAEREMRMEAAAQQRSTEVKERISDLEASISGLKGDIADLRRSLDLTLDARIRRIARKTRERVRRHT